MDCEDNKDGECEIRLRRPGSQETSSNSSPKSKPSDSVPKKAGSGPEIPGVFSFFWAELSRGYDIRNDSARYTEKRRKVYAFLLIPRELERFLWFGFLQCLDAFLYYFTFLPLRFLVAFCRLLVYPFTGNIASSEICDLLKMVILIAASCLLQYVDTSVMYHLVRGQTVIKLYIFYNMLEVMLH